jgi:hypothetical protein
VDVDPEADAQLPVVTHTAIIAVTRPGRCGTLVR